MAIKQVIKRDGSSEKFYPQKISNSIQKALENTGHNNSKLAERIAKEAVSTLQKKYKNKSVPVEEIKETVEWVLVKNKLGDVARQYILFRYS